LVCIGDIHPFHLFRKSKMDSDIATYVNYVCEPLRIRPLDTLGTLEAMSIFVPTHTTSFAVYVLILRLPTTTEYQK
jgi:predicted permease